jgi:hypothetical protein
MIFPHLALLDAPVNILDRGGVVHAALGRAQVHAALQTTQLGLVNRIDEILQQRVQGTFKKLLVNRIIDRYGTVQFTEHFSVGPGQDNMIPILYLINRILELSNVLGIPSKKNYFYQDYQRKCVSEFVPRMLLLGLNSRK